MNREVYNKAQREYLRFKKYGVSPETYAEMSRKQGHVCAICARPETGQSRGGAKKTLAVDHCHDTKQIRGLLCARCNIGLGYFKHDISLLVSARNYLDNVEQVDLKQDQRYNNLGCHQQATEELMTKAEIQAQYSQLAMQMGDLQFRIEDQTKLLDILKQTADSLRKKREDLQKQLNELPKDDEKTPVSSGASDAVEPATV